MNEQKPKVFISYSWEDKEISRKLADFLRRDGAKVWIDYSENKAGDSFVKKMNSGLEWCDTFVLLWSESAKNSNFVSMEWEGALTNNLKIIPCLLDKTKLPYILSGRIYKDVSNFDEGYSSLAKDLNLIIKPKTTVFRSSPKELSEADVKTMLKKYGFHDIAYNKKGKGFNHQYETKIIKGDKVVVDSASGLMWQQGGSSDNMVDYENAKKYIDKLNNESFAGFTDWRLPTLEEAVSLIEPEKMNEFLYINPIFDSKQVLIWTADHLKGESQAPWVVYFNFRTCNARLTLHFRDHYFFYVRAVRSGQSSQE